MNVTCHRIWHAHSCGNGSRDGSGTFKYCSFSWSSEHFQPGEGDAVKPLWHLRHTEDHSRRCWYSSKSFFFYTDLFPLPPSVSTWSRHSSETLQFRTQRKHNLMLFIATSFFWFTEFISRAAECSLLATEKWLGIRWLDTNFGYKPTRKTPQGSCELCWTWWWQWRGKQISLANMMSSRGAASCWFSPLT